MNCMVFNKIKMTLTEDFMDTLIEDTEHKRIIVVNNLFICNMAINGNWFFEQALRQPDGILPMESDLFPNLEVRCVFCTRDFVITDVVNGLSIVVNQNMFIDYYNHILCNIRKKENIENTNFVRKENLNNFNNKGEN